MYKQTILFGVLLILLGLTAYFGTGRESPTALIPAWFGAPLAVLGLVAIRPEARMHAMHIAVIVGLLGTIAPLVRLAMTLGKTAAVAHTVQLLMVIICGIYVGLSVRSFIRARAQRMESTVNS